MSGLSTRLMPQKNYIRKIPIFGTQIALMKDEEPHPWRFQLPRF